MNKKFNEFVRELKTSVFSVYPSISDVLHTLSMNLIPKFEVSYDDGRKRSLAIISIYDAVKIFQYDDLIEKIQDPKSVKNNSNINLVFKAISPAITAWVNQSNCTPCSRTLASLFVKILENENASLVALVDEITWQLNEEYKHAASGDEKNSILLALQNLEKIKH